MNEMKGNFGTISESQVIYFQKHFILLSLIIKFPNEMNNKGAFSVGDRERELTELSSASFLSNNG